MSGEGHAATNGGLIQLVRAPGSFFEYQLRRVLAFMETVGEVSKLSGRFVRTLFTSRFDFHAFVQQLDSLGVKSLYIAMATAVFVAIVMTIQFGIFAEKYGAKLALPRTIGIAEARELAPALTSLVVGCRIAAGMAAELGSMAVTEQIDAIRSLGADPIRRLVVPRVMAGIVALPLMCAMAFLLGMATSTLVADVVFGLPAATYASTSSWAIGIRDWISGLSKTPIFGFLITIIGCHYGMSTRGGTEGVGRATTSAVVVAAITVLVADALLTQIFVAL